MKKSILTLAMAIAAVCVSCKKENNETGDEWAGNTAGKTEQIDFTSTDGKWHYYSFSTGKEVGTGEENETDNAAWAARSDWDIAMNKYKIRTNSGDSGKGEGGVCILDESYTFAAVGKVAESAEFKTDKTTTQSGMGGETVSSISEATVILFKTDADGNKVMPPVYLKAPVYVFRTADGKSYYKVEYTQYQAEQNGENVSGLIKFNQAAITK